MTRPALRPLALLRQHQRQISTSLPRQNTPPIPVPVSLIASLRKLRPVPLSLAREALQRSNNNVESALSYLDSSTSASTAKKAEKVSGRSTSEGVIAISLLGGKRVGMVHVACETDFVARNDIFLKTSRSIAETTAFLDVPGEREPTPTSPAGAPPTVVDPIQNFPVSALMEAPIISLPSSSSDAAVTGPDPTPTTDPTTISQSLLSTLSQTGENLRLLRAVSFAAPFPSSPLIRYVPGAYAHGGSSSTEGKVGGIAVISAQSRDSEKPMAARIHGVGGDELEKDLLALARTIARQVVGFPTTRIHAGEGGEGEEEALLSQQAMMFGKQELVGQVLEEWGVEKGLKVDVVGFRRWSVGDDLSVPEA